MEKSNSSFIKKERVYYEYTDAGGIVYHSNYLNFMERCRCDWLDQIGYSVKIIQQKFGLMFVVSSADVQFHAPAHLFDELDVTCDVLHVGKVKLIVEQKIYNKEQLLCSATIKLATLDETSYKLRGMPDELRNKLLGH